MSAATAKKPSLGSVGKLSGLLNKKEATTATAPSGKPLELEIARIHEDPNQPRKVFNPAKMKELEESIALRGVKTPISVRPHPEIEGEYVINHGARRFRASKSAGKTTIPGFIDADYTDADQVIENIQRDGLTPREVADYVGRKLSEGMKQKQIAKELGMSEAFVSQHATLLDLPEPIAEAFNDDRCRDVTLINELTKAYKKKPDEVTEWLADPTQEITRGTVKLLREFLEQDKQSDDGPDEEPNAGDGNPQENDAPPKSAKEADPTKIKKAIVQVEHYGRPARLILDKRPSEIGLAWMKYDDDGQVFEASITEAKLVGIVEG